MMNFRDERSALIDEVEALRAQVQELQALGVSLHKAADAGAQAERAAVVAWLLRLECAGMAKLCAHCFARQAAANAIKRGDHRQDKP